MAVDPNELARKLRDKLADKESGVSPTRGRIITGLVTSQNMSVRARPERPPLTPLEALFADANDDPPNTKYYTAPSGVCNTTRKDGTLISFIHGVYKTADPDDIKLLDYLVKRGHIQELLPPTPADDDGTA